MIGTRQRRHLEIVGAKGGCRSVTRFGSNYCRCGREKCNASVSKMPAAASPASSTTTTGTKSTGSGGEERLSPMPYVADAWVDMKSNVERPIAGDSAGAIPNRAFKWLLLALEVFSLWVFFNALFLVPAPYKGVRGVIIITAALIAAGAAWTSAWMFKREQGITFSNLGDSIDCSRCHMCLCSGCVRHHLDPSSSCQGR